MKTVILLVVLAFSCGAAAQKPKPEDVSQTIEGTVTIRNNDGSIRPAPFVQVYIYESIGDKPIDPVNAWNFLESTAKPQFEKFPASLTCKELLSAVWVFTNNVAAHNRADKSGNWDEMKEQGLVLYSSFYTDKDGNFENDIGAPSSSSVCMRPEGCDMTALHLPRYKKGETIVSPPMNFYGKFLLIAFLDTPTTQYYWEEQITVREGEKTPPVVLTDPVICNSVEGAK